MRLFQQSLFTCDGPGKCASFMSEELGFEERFG